MKFKTNAIPFSLHLHPRSAAAFHLWMVGRNRIVGRVLGGQRIHVGASEAALLPDASAHAGRAVLLPWKNASQLPLGAYPRNLVRHDFYCRSFLYTEWYPRNKLRLDQYCHYICRRYLRLFVENDVYRNGKAEKLILSSAILLLLTAAFFTFTEYPPQLGIFQ